MGQLSSIKATNANVVNSLTADDKGLQKEASTNINSFLRLKAREDGVARAIMEPIHVTPDDFDRQEDTVKPVIIRDMEPGSRGAVSVPFGNVPSDMTMDAPRYRIIFDRIRSERYTADKNNLLTYDFDIKKVFNDLMLKDIMDEEDRKLFGVTNMLATNGNVRSDNILTATSGARDNSYAYFRNTVQSRGYADVGPMTRESLTTAFKAIPSSNRHLNCKTAIINNITTWDIVALNFDSVGGDFAEELFHKGFTMRELMGVKLLITIKTDLIPTSFMYMYSSPEFLGDFCILDDVTIANKSENYLIDLFAYECIGATIKNEGALAIASFGVSGESANAPLNNDGTVWQ